MPLYAEICTKYARNSHKYANEKYAIYEHNKPKICIMYADICVICLNMYESKYAVICRFKYAEICSTKYAGICTNQQIGNMQYICVHNKHKFAKICKTKICTYMQKYHMHKYAQNIHKYAKQNMHKYAFSKYHKKFVLYAQICIIC